MRAISRPRRSASQTPPRCRPEQHQRIEAAITGVAFEDLVRHPGHGPPHVILAEHQARRSRRSLRFVADSSSVRASRDPLHGRIARYQPSTRPSVIAVRGTVVMATYNEAASIGPVLGGAGRGGDDAAPRRHRARRAARRRRLARRDRRRRPTRGRALRPPPRGDRRARSHPRRRRSWPLPPRRRRRRRPLHRHPRPRRPPRRPPDHRSRAHVPRPPQRADDRLSLGARRVVPGGRRRHGRWPAAPPASWSGAALDCGGCATPRRRSGSSTSRSSARCSKTACNRRATASTRRSSPSPRRTGSASTRCRSCIRPRYSDVASLSLRDVVDFQRSLGPTPPARPGGARRRCAPTRPRGRPAPAACAASRPPSTPRSAPMSSSSGWPAPSASSAGSPTRSRPTSGGASSRSVPGSARVSTGAGRAPPRRRDHGPRAGGQPLRRAAGRASAAEPRITARKATSTELLDDEPAPDVRLGRLRQRARAHPRRRAASCATAHELLVPGGTLAVFVPALPRLYGSLDYKSGHHRRYRRGDLAAHRSRRPGSRWSTSATSTCSASRRTTRCTACST